MRPEERGGWEEEKGGPNGAHPRRGKGSRWEEWSGVVG